MKIKKITQITAVLLLLGMMTSTHATAAGFYMGLQAGKTYTHNKPVTLQTGPPPSGQPQTGTETFHPTNTGVGGRIFMGYNVTQYWGLEAGFTHYALSTITVPANPRLSIGNPVGDPGISTNGFDFVGKGMLPIASSGFGVYGKLGFAIIKVGKAGTYITTYDNSTGTNVVGSRANTYVRPTAGLGFTYDFNQNWQAELSAARVFGGGGMQAADLVALGISYHFVDKFCGQFLC